MFKKLLSIFLFLFVSFNALAQSKVGTVDIDYILSKMPELSGVQANLETYGKKLDTDLQAKYTEYDTLLKAYQEGELNFTDQIKKEKQSELLTLENDIGKFQQNGAKLINLKKDEELRPLYQKIGIALEKVASTGKFTQIMQVSDALVYIDPSLDITLAVCKELGITITEE